MPSVSASGRIAVVTDTSELEAARQDFDSKAKLAEEWIKAGREQGDKALAKRGTDLRYRARMAYEMRTARWQLQGRGRALPDEYRLRPAVG